MRIAKPTDQLIASLFPSFTVGQIARYYGISRQRVYRALQRAEPW
jgi:DNA-binding phage protein